MTPRAVIDDFFRFSESEACVRLTNFTAVISTAAGAAGRLKRGREFSNQLAVRYLWRLGIFERYRPAIAFYGFRKLIVI